MHILQAIRWAIIAQKEVTLKVINSCFIKSTLFGLREGLLPRPSNYIDPVINKVQEIAKQLYTTRRIYKPINIQNFIYLLGEDIVDSTKDLIKHVAELYTRLDYNIEIDKEDS